MIENGKTLRLDCEKKTPKGKIFAVSGAEKPEPLILDVLKKNKVTSAEAMTASKEIYLKAGHALIFVDSLCHGSAKRINKGERRIVVYRYGPSWGFFRYPYRPSMNLLKNLNSFQRKIVMPHEKILTP